MNNRPSDVRTILSPEALERMRSSYDGRALLEAANAATTAPFSDAAPLFAALSGTFFEQQTLLGAGERELVIIALFTGTTPAWMLAVHVYIGLMEGLGVEKIAGAVLLSAMYRHGVAAYTEAIAVVERSLSVMRDIAEQG